MSTEDSGDPAGALIDVGASRERASGERTPRDAGIEVGTWWWMDVKWSGTDKAVPTLVCITHIGSNYVKVATLQTVPNGYDAGSEYSWRIHFRDFWTELRPAPQAASVMKLELRASQDRIREYTAEVQRIAASLAVSPMTALPGSHPEAQNMSAMVVASSADPKAYGEALVKAKKETLPELYKKIKIEHEVASAWLMMPLIASQAQLVPEQRLIDAISDRIFTVKLYAGMTEEIVQVQDGAPAHNDTPVHIMQRRAYMDEESLCDYDAGGMDFRDIRKFDAWLARPHNMRRLLPFDRCVLAFRVRRTAKGYRASTLWEFIETLGFNEANQLTYLYLRNGEQLYRLSTDVEFGELLFPDADRELLTSQQLWANLSAKSVISDAEFQGRVADYEAKVAADKVKRRAVMRRAFAEWRLRGSVPDETNVRKYVERQIFKECGFRSGRNHFHDPRQNYTRFTPDVVEYDDIAAFVAKELKAHNRIILILQGLLDRSPCFQPHPPWQIFTDKGFAQGVRYVYDHYHAVTSGPPPDFEAYRAKLNRGITTGSVCVGQHAAWESTRKRASRDGGRYNHNDWHNPDPGPGLIARVARTSRGKVVFEWKRKMERYANDRWRRTQTEIVDRKIALSPDHVLCLDNYQLGDYKQFFLDPRTRAEYLVWAPVLLVAEEYKAGIRTLETRGNRKSQDPDVDSDVTHAAASLSDENDEDAEDDDDADDEGGKS